MHPQATTSPGLLSPATARYQLGTYLRTHRHERSLDLAPAAAHAAGERQRPAARSGELHNCPTIINLKPTSTSAIFNLS
jgi:hypothetical protein